MSRVGLLVALAIGVAIFCWVMFAMVFMASRRKGPLQRHKFKPSWLFRKYLPPLPDEEMATTVTEFLNQGQNPHPPVYCVEDLEVPPPAYRPADHQRRPSGQELRTLNMRLRELKREISSCSNVYDAAICQNEIQHLTEWIRKLEAFSRLESSVRVVPDGQDEDDDDNDHFNRTSRRHRHRIIIQRETGWIGIGLPREVRPILDEFENTLVVRRNSEPPRPPLAVVEMAAPQTRYSC